MKTQEQIKQFIVEKLKEKGLALNAASIAIGKHGTYLFQYINKSVPKRLPEAQRKRLANLLDVLEQDLTDIDLTDNGFEPLFISGINRAIDKAAEVYQSLTSSVKIDILDVTACCGQGNEISSENITGKWTMSESDFRSISLTSNPKNVKMIKAVGDSMAQTINDGDWCLVDTSLNSATSDGIYLIRMSTGLAIKRLQGGLTDEIVVKSDNPIYDPINAKIANLRIIGRVIYILNARKV